MVGIDTVDGKITMPSSDKNGLKATVARTPPNGPKKKGIKVGKVKIKATQAMKRFFTYCKRTVFCPDIRIRPFHSGFLVIMSCSPDPTTNSKTTNVEFSQTFYQPDCFCQKNNKKQTSKTFKISQLIREISGS